jgi:hypothetical protein
MYTNIYTDIRIATIKDLIYTNMEKIPDKFPTNLFLQISETSMKKVHFLAVQPPSGCISLELSWVNQLHVPMLPSPMGTTRTLKSLLLSNNKYYITSTTETDENCTFVRVDENHALEKTREFI